MKKRICLFLIMAVLSSLFTAGAVSAAPADESTEKLGFLNALGVINSEYDAAEDIVSRENFALFTARLLGMDVEEKSKVRYFTDVEQNSYAANAINLLTEAGYITGFDSGLFRPADAITTEQACCILLNIMDYGAYAGKYSGTDKYTRTARDLDIIKTSNSQKQLTVADAAEILVNAGTTGFCVISEMGVGSVKYGTDDENTILSRYRGIYSGKGTLTDVYGGSVEGNNILPEDEVIIDGVKYTVSDDVDAYAYFGRYVDYFYYADEPGDGGEVMYLADYSCKYESIVTDIALFKSLDTSSMVCWRDGFRGTRKYDLKNPAIIYNGYPLSTGVAQVLSELNKGTITLTDRNNDGNYDTVIIDDYKNFVVGNVDAQNKYIYNLLNTADVLRLNEYDTCVFADTDGNSVDLKKLSKYTVISVKRSSYISARAMSAVVSDSSVNGVFRGIEEDDYAYALVGEDKYEIDKSYLEDFRQHAHAGETYCFKTDIFGKVAYITEETSSDMKFGYLFKNTYKLDEVDFDTDGMYLKILSDDGAVSKIFLAERVAVDGRTYKHIEDAVKYMATSNGSLTANECVINEQMIRYNLNTDGKIINIDTLAFDSAYETEENSITSIYNGAGTEWWFNINRLGVKAVLDSKTKIFCVPSGEGTPEPEDCTVGKYSDYFTSDRFYSADAFYSGSQSAFADAVIYYYGADVKKRAFMVSKFEKGLNDDGEAVTKLSGYDDGSLKQINVDSEISFANINKGDVVILQYDFRGNVVKDKNGSADVIKVYDAGQNKTVGWNNITAEYTRYNSGTANSYRNEVQFSFGYVKTNNSGVITISNTAGGTAAETAYVGSVPIVVYDSNETKDNIYLGLANDIIDYRGAGANCDKVIIKSSGPHINCVYVFR